MRLVESLANEYYGLATEYRSRDEQTRDTIDLVEKFAEDYDHFDDDTDKVEFTTAWTGFVRDHKRQLSVMQTGMILYILLTYWPQGQRLYLSVPPLEQILLEEIQAEMDYEQRRQTLLNNGNDPVE